MRNKGIARTLAISLALASAGGDAIAQPVSPEPLSIVEQGSFAVGGSVLTSQGKYNPNPDITKNRSSNDFLDVFQASVAAGGQTLHGDHATVFYQVPQNARQLPLVFLHGAGQSMRTWQTTPDGREGFQNIFLRRQFPVYLIDQPRRGQSGRSMVDGSIPATPDDQFWYAQFRIGIYPKFFDGVAFPKDPVALDQFFRQMTPNTAPFDAGVISDSLQKLFERTGDGILVTHSQGGIVGWMAGIRSEKIKAIVSYEPGNFPFPEGEVPETITSSFGDIEPSKVSREDFAKLTRMPIIIYFGDNIPDKPSKVQGEDQWRIRIALARQWADVVNRHGGDATVLHLPSAGIKGNTHFPFSDLNNVQVADHLSGWLNEKGLDKHAKAAKSAH